MRHAAGIEYVRRGATVALTASTPFVRVLSEAGHDAVEERAKTLRQLLPRFHLSEEALAVQGARIPHELSLEILSRSAFRLGSEAIAVRAVRAWRFGDHGIGDYLNATSATVGDLLATMEQHVGLLHDGIRFLRKTDGARTLFLCEFDDDVVRHRWFTEVVLGKIVAELRRAFGTGRPPGLVGVHFAEGAPSYEREFRHVFDVPVDFAQRHDALVFSSTALDTALPTADPVLHDLLRRQAATMLPPGRERRSLLEEVQSLVREELPTSSGDQNAVARRLGMSPATLRRRLEERHATRYCDVLDALRRDTAASGLGDTTLSIDEVGRRAGFSQKTAFYRAFRRWFGCTPAEYRRARALR